MPQRLNFALIQHLTNTLVEVPQVPQRLNFALIQHLTNTLGSMWFQRGFNAPKNNLCPNPNLE